MEEAQQDNNNTLFSISERIDEINSNCFNLMCPLMYELSHGMGNLHLKTKSHHSILLKISGTFKEKQNHFAQSMHVYNECVYEDTELIQEKHKLKREKDLNFVKYCLKKKEERRKIGLLQDVDQQIINTKVEKKNTSTDFFFKFFSFFLKFFYFF